MTHTTKIETEADRLRALHIIRHMDITVPQQVKVTDWKKNRSVEQNRLLWKWNSILSEALGYASAVEIHEALKFKHCVPILIRTDEAYAAGVVALKAALAKASDEEGEALRKFIVRQTSTTALSVKLMTEYLQAISSFAADMNIILPL